MNDHAASPGTALEDRVRHLEEKVQIMEGVIREEKARADLLYDVALRRNAITEEEWALARDPEGPRHLQEAKIVRSGHLVPETG